MPSTSAPKKTQLQKEKFYWNPACLHGMVTIESVLLLATGFALGLLHSFDPDHVVAVSTLLCNSPSLRKSIISATAWGAGHSVTLLIVGVLVFGFRVVIPDSVVYLFEIAAGTMLIILGAIVLKPFLADKIRRHRQGSSQPPEAQTKLEGSEGHHTVHQVQKSVLTGILQGLAGSAALMLVTLTTVNSLELGLVFILLFAVGLVLGMVSVACLIGSLMAYTAKHIEKVHEKIMAVTGSVSIGFGVYLVIQMLLQHPF